MTGLEKIQSKEKLDDKENLKQVQDFVKEMNDLLFKAGDQKITKGTTKLETESLRGDGSSFIRMKLSKNGKEVFNYDMHASMFHKENGEKWPVGVNMKIEGKKMSYSGDDKNEHGVFDHHELLEKASQYKKEIKSMLKSKELTENVSDFKNEFADLKAIVDVENLA